MDKYEIKVYDEKGIIPKKCPWCERINLTRLQPGQWACKSCRKLFFVTEISDEEMIEWFID